jgi:uncharacterized protein YndB with AHSA1/START domain
MKIVKIVLISLVGLVALLVVAAVFMPKSYTIEKEVVISKPKVIVFQYLVYLQNQDDFSVWMKMDPKARKDSRGEDGTVGYVSTWDSDVENVGQGEQEITNIVDGERIDYELRFLKPYQSVAKSYITTTATENNETKVKWGFEGTTPFPMNLMLPFLKASLGGQLQQGLDELKKIMEERS